MDPAGSPAAGRQTQAARAGTCRHQEVQSKQGKWVATPWQLAWPGLRAFTMQLHRCCLAAQWRPHLPAAARLTSPPAACRGAPPLEPPPAQLAEAAGPAGWLLWHLRCCPSRPRAGPAAACRPGANQKQPRHNTEHCTQCMPAAASTCLLLSHWKGRHAAPGAGAGRSLLLGGVCLRDVVAATIGAKLPTVVTAVAWGKVEAVSGKLAPEATTAAVQDEAA